MQSIRFSSCVVAIPNIGGILCDSLSAKQDPRALPVSERLESAYLHDPRAPWVVVDLPSCQAAVTTTEAREMGLQEAAWE